MFQLSSLLSLLLKRKRRGMADHSILPLGAIAKKLKSAILSSAKLFLFPDFNLILNDIRFKLNAFPPLLDQIDELNDSINYPKGETDKLRYLMEEGTILLLQCDNVNLGNLNSLMKKLRNLDNEIRRFMNVFKLQVARNHMNNLKMMNQLVSKLDHGQSSKTVDLDSSVSVSVSGSVSPCGVPELGEETVGLDNAVELLKQELLRSENQMVVVTAPGGTGKTTLALKFCHDNRVKDIFQERIFFVTVSRKPDLKFISYFEELWRKQASQKKFLIVLDDVWDGLESDHLLDKFSKMSGCKILVTSRFLFRKFSVPFYLEPMNHEDAMKLFNFSASLEMIRKSFIIDENIVEKIVGGCKRLPLALKLIGKSLSRCPPSTWKDTVDKWSEGGSIFDHEGALLECLRTSLDEIEMKESFMNLGSFPENRSILASTFIDMCAALCEQDELEAICTIDELSSRSLVNLFSPRNNACDEGYNEIFFTQHAILRELAIYLIDMESIEQRKRLILNINKNDLPKWWAQQEMQPTNARLVSITTDEWFSSCWPDMKAPEVKVLILNLWSRTYSWPEFIKRMTKLKALIVTNYGSHMADMMSDYQVMDNLSHLERIRFERISIPPFGNHKPLMNLRKISFLMCKVGKSLTNSSTQFSELLPNLLEISIDFCNDLMTLPDGICEIANLRKLRITNCHGLTFLPEVGKLTNLRNLSLRSCIYLEELPESITQLRELVILDISQCSSLTRLPENLGELHELKKLDMRGCLNLSKLPLSVTRLENLKLLCDEEMAGWLKIVTPCLAKQVEVHVESPNLDWLFKSYP